MRAPPRVRAVFGEDFTKILSMLTRAQGMHDGMAADTATYSAPNPTLSVFQGLITNLDTAQQATTLRTKGAAAARNVHRGLLLTAMESERMYIQTLADANPSRAVVLIENAGLVVARPAVHEKALLTLRQGKQSGTVICEANVHLLKSALTLRPTQYVFFNWSYTVDGGKSFINLPPTTTGRTTITNLTPLTTVGVRVNLNALDGPGEWSQVVYLLVH
jgi:hypothetical protein